jgi:Putative MetA-pathway of phenol degradation
MNPTPPRTRLKQRCARWLARGLILVTVGSASAQELEPRSYAPSPTGFNILVVADTYSDGAITFDPSLPITDATAHIQAAALGYVRTMGVAGRSGSLGFFLPYARGHLDGLYLGEPQALYRSGLGDPRVRFALNLYGAPAMTPKEFASYQPTTIIGASLVISAPLGQYDPGKLINIGTNRWAFKPELGFSRTLGRWTLEADAGAWLYTDNTDFFGGKTRSQDPIASFQGHVIYTFHPRWWVAFDANYFRGGRTSIDGVPNDDLQRNSRMGVTFALPLARQQSLKLSYSRGAYTNIGGNFASFGIAWQSVWRD